MSDASGPGAEPKLAQAPQDPEAFEHVLNDAVPGAILEAHRDGLVVAPDKLLALAHHLHDLEGYDYLSMVTSVDYPSRFEVLYYLYGAGRLRPELILKVRLPDKASPALPSVTQVWPGADFQEREIYDLMGIRFDGHPNLRRILLWEGFQGYPLRKDWREPYYEEEVKPFRSRHPEGRHNWAEDRVPWHDNVQYPEAWDPELWSSPEVQYRRIMGVDDPSRDGTAGEIKTDRILVNFGPQHPSTHGVFRMICAVEGEKIVGLEPEMGYLHRNHEKIAERNTWLMNIPFTDRLDYIASMSNNLSYVLTVEKLMGIQVPERADYIRVIMAELTRIVSHFIAIGFLFNDLGAYFTPALYGMREREFILDLFEAASGSRMMCNYMRFGGIANDLPEGWAERARDLVWNRLPRAMDEFDSLLTGNEIFTTRTRGLGRLSAREAIAYSMAGPMLPRFGRPLRRAPGAALLHLQSLRLRRHHPARGRRVPRGSWSACARSGRASGSSSRRLTGCPQGRPCRARRITR